MAGHALPLGEHVLGKKALNLSSFVLWSKSRLAQMRNHTQKALPLLVHTAPNPVQLSLWSSSLDVFRSSYGTTPFRTCHSAWGQKTLLDQQPTNVKFLEIIGVSTRALVDERRLLQGHFDAVECAAIRHGVCPPGDASSGQPARQMTKQLPLQELSMASNV